MSWFGNMFGTSDKNAPDTAQKQQYSPEGTSAQRMQAWELALAAHRVPPFVEQRLRDAAAGKLPWISTMTPAELRLARSHGVRPLGMVSGTCWLHYGFSWTKGHAEGWHAALERLRAEARLLGANAVVDVKMRKIALDVEESMDFTLIGTAVRIEGLPPSIDPVVATVPALEFVRLLEVGVVPVGIAIGADYAWQPESGVFDYVSMSMVDMDGANSMVNQPLTFLGRFWEGVRRSALTSLNENAKRLGNGVLAHTHFGQLFKFGEGKDEPRRYLGRHIVIGTVIDTRRDISISLGIKPVVDMRDDGSPLNSVKPHGHNAYTVEDEEGAI